MDQHCQGFFPYPSQRRDNRFFKNNANYPHFKRQSTHQGLWIDVRMKAEKATIPLGQIQSGGGLRAWVPDPFRIGYNVGKLCQEGQMEEAVQMLELLVQKNVKAPVNAYVSLLKGCAGKKTLREGKRAHALIVQTGLDSEILIGKTLVDMYAKCGSLFEARKVFDTMPQHNVFSWTAIITAYADHGRCEEAIDLFQQMQQTAIAPDKVVFLVVLKACARTASFEQGKRLHSKIIKGGLDSDLVVRNALVDMYAKCGALRHAHRLFDRMSERDVVSWNSLIAGYILNGDGNQALVLYEKMKQEGLQPSTVTYVLALKACASIAALDKGKQLHSEIIKCGFESNVIVGNTLVDMYAKCGCIEHARRVFNNMSERDVVSWTAMIAGDAKCGCIDHARQVFDRMSDRNLVSWTAMIAAYAHNGQGMEALVLYEQMKQAGLKPSNVTYVVLLKACASIAALEEGKQLHSCILRSDFESDVIVGNALVDMYAKCGCIDHACEVFNKMCERDVVSWNSLIAAYTQNGLCKKALQLYKHMKQDIVQPSIVTYVLVLKACANIAAIEEGKDLHSEIIKSGFESDVTIGNTLVDMYAKCGCIDHAREVFDKMEERDVVSWNAIIAGYAKEGLGKEALILLEQMQRESIKPDEVTYLSVLSACSHSGLVDEGHSLFESMCKTHGLTPTMKHYVCMVDLLGRAGCLADAEDFISKILKTSIAVV